MSTAPENKSKSEARLLVSTSLAVYGDLIDQLGEAAGTLRFAELVAENAALLGALAADGWQLAVDEFAADEVYLYGSKRFSSLDEALAAARALGTSGRTIGWDIGGEEDEYLEVD